MVFGLMNLGPGTPGSKGVNGLETQSLGLAFKHLSLDNECAISKGKY